MSIGKRYANYLNASLAILNDLNQNYNLNLNVFITHDTNFIQTKKFLNLNLFLNLIEKPKNLARPWEFPFSLKKEAIKFAAKSLLCLPKINNFKNIKFDNLNKDNKNAFVFIDSDLFFAKNFEHFIFKILDKYENGIYGRFIWGNFVRYKYNKKIHKKFQFLKEKYNLLFNNENYKSVYINKDLDITYFFLENFLIFNLPLQDILKFCEKWDDISEILEKEKKYEYRTESAEIAIAGMLSNINVKILPICYRRFRKYYKHIRKRDFDKNNLDNNGNLII